MRYSCKKKKRERTTANTTYTPTQRDKLHVNNLKLNSSILCLYDNKSEKNYDLSEENISTYINAYT